MSWVARVDVHGHDVLVAYAQTFGYAFVGECGPGVVGDVVELYRGSDAGAPSHTVARSQLSVAYLHLSAVVIFRSVGSNVHGHDGLVVCLVEHPSLQSAVGLVAPVAFVRFVIDHIFRIAVGSAHGDVVVVAERDALCGGLPVVLVEQIVGGIAGIDARCCLGINHVAQDGTVGHLHAQVVGVADFGILHVEFDDAESGAQISIVAVDGDVVHRLVGGHVFVFVITDVGHRIVGMQQVDVLVVVNDYKLFGRSAPGDVCDARVGELSCLVVGIDTMVIHMVNEQRAAAQHEDIVACGFYIRHAAISQIGGPFSYGRLGDVACQEEQHQNDACNFSHISMFFEQCYLINESTNAFTALALWLMVFLMSLPSWANVLS